MHYPTTFRTVTSMAEHGTVTAMVPAQEMVSKISKDQTSIMLGHLLNLTLKIIKQPHPGFVSG